MLGDLARDLVRRGNGEARDAGCKGGGMGGVEGGEGEEDLLQQDPGDIAPGRQTVGGYVLVRNGYGSVC